MSNPQGEVPIEDPQSDCILIEEPIETIVIDDTEEANPRGCIFSKDSIIMDTIKK